MNTTFRLLVAACAMVAAASAQHSHSTPAPAAPVTLIPGLGTWKHTIRTNSPEAQKYFNQGLILLYGFNRFEAVRSFRKATELDPSAPMAWWGVAMATAPYINMDGDPTFNIRESCEALDTGLAQAADARERAYLEAASTRCPDFADPEKYVDAARALATRYPDDLDAQVLFAESILIPARWRWYSADGQPARGMDEAERALEAVLRRDNTHPGANHYYIHAVESSPTPERAIASAQRLMGLVPSAGHVVHMPGHIWLVLGDFNMTVAVNQRAVEVDRKYFQNLRSDSPYYMYYLHNLHFILYARDMQGRIAEAKKAEQALIDAIAPVRNSMAELAEVFGTTILTSQLRTGRWDEVLEARIPEMEGPSAAIHHYSRSVALFMKNRRDEASLERSKFEVSKGKLDRGSQWGVNKLGDVLDVASAILEARSAASAATAVPLWRKAVEAQDRLAYDEPPAWYYPVRESLGAALLLAGDAAAAENVFRDALRRSPHNGRVLFGLLETLKAQNKTDAVEAVQREFNTAWGGSEMKLRLGEM